MNIKFRTADERDIQYVMKLEKEMYGEDYTQGTFRKYFSIFPEGFLLAEDRDVFEQDNKIVGFVVTIRLNDVKSIPYVHDPKDYHEKDGPIIYLSGFGVNKKYQEENVGVELYEQVIKLAKSLNIKKYVVICMENEPGDAYEISILKKLGFAKETIVDWEVAPGRVIKHEAWVKNV